MFPSFGERRKPACLVKLSYESLPTIHHTVNHPGRCIGPRLGPLGDGCVGRRPPGPKLVLPGHFWRSQGTGCVTDPTTDGDFLGDTDRYHYPYTNTNGNSHAHKHTDDTPYRDGDEHANADENS